MRRHPYADLGEVYAEETSTARVKVRPTPKAPTDSSEQPEEDTSMPNGMTIRPA